jgi:hypothetical protein
LSALLFPKKLLQTSLNSVQAASSTSFKSESNIFKVPLFMGQQKSFLLSLPHSSGGISVADTKTQGRPSS